MKLQQFYDDDQWRWYAESEEHLQRGEFYASITKILDHIQAEKMQAYMKKNSAAKQEKHLKYTADLGTRIHKAAEQDLRGLPIDLTDDIRPAFEQWKLLRETCAIQANHTELTVYHPHLFFAGTCDIIGSFRDVASGREFQNAVMDIKTGFYSVKAGWQMAAYHAACQQMGIPVDGMAGLSVKRDGSVGQPFVYQHIDSCYRVFLACLESFKMLYWNKLAKMKWAGLQVTGLEVKSFTKKEEVAA